MTRKKSIKKKKDAYRDIASRRIIRLFQLAYGAAKNGEMNLADRYVNLARRISMRYLVKIPREYKLLFCKHCYRYIIPGVNARIRINKGRRTVTCIGCNGIMRMPLKNKMTNM